MKIGFVIDDTLDSSDGVQQYVLLLGRWFSRQGHEVHYLAGQSARTDIANLHSLARNIRVGFNRNKLTIPFFAASGHIKHILSKEQFDVLHVQMPFSPMLAGKIISNAPKKTAIVATFHIAPHSQLVTRSTRALATMQKKHLQKINKFVSVSEVAQAFAHKTYHINSQIIPNAIETSIWRPRLVKKQLNQIVFVGRLVKRKGVIYLLEACNELVKEGHTNIKLIIAGDGEQRKQVEEYIIKHNLSTYVRCTGFVTEKQKRRLLQESYLAVFPSTGGESFGIVLLEAMAAGTVTLGGNNSGYAGVLNSVPDSLFDPQNIIELKNLITSVFNNQEIYNNMLHKQQDCLKKYDIEKVGSDILNVYNDAINQQEERSGTKPR